MVPNVTNRHQRLFLLLFDSFLCCWWWWRIHGFGQVIVHSFTFRPLLFNLPLYRSRISIGHTVQRQFQDFESSPLLCNTADCDCLFRHSVVMVRQTRILHESFLNKKKFGTPLLSSRFRGIRRALLAFNELGSVIRERAACRKSTALNWSGSYWTHSTNNTVTVWIITGWKCKSFYKDGSSSQSATAIGIKIIDTF